jgi:hypothetical protein
MGEVFLTDLKQAWSRLQARAADAFERVFGTPAGDVERGLRQWPVAGALWVGISALLLLLLLASQLPGGG